METEQLMPVTFRLPPDLYRLLKNRSEAGCRSMAMEARRIVSKELEPGQLKPGKQLRKGERV